MSVCQCVCMCEQNLASWQANHVLLLCVSLLGCLDAWSSGCLHDCTSAFLCLCLSGRLSWCYMADWLAVWLDVWRVGRLLGMTDWLSGLSCLDLHLVGSFVSRQGMWLAGCSSCCFGWLIHCLRVWLSACLSGWLAGYMAGWLSNFTIVWLFIFLSLSNRLVGRR